jgi:hypothetical protein
MRREGSTIFDDFPTVDVVEIYRRKDPRILTKEQRENPVYDQLIKIVPSTRYVGRNDMKMELVSKELENGDTLYSDDSIIMSFDKRIGRQYKLLIIDRKQGSTSNQQFMMVSWQIIYGTADKP